jgi:hypothetical protein
MQTVAIWNDLEYLTTVTDLVSRGHEFENEANTDMLLDVIRC